MKLISMLSNEDAITGGITEEEKQIIQATEAAIEGSDIKLIPYKDAADKDSILENEYGLLRNTYKAEDIIVTSFIADLYRNLQNEPGFMNEVVPTSVRISYNYLPTLKGKEFKAGIIVLDEVVCQLLNTNRILFDRVDSSLRGTKLNSRFYLNLLYVALSRFRDFITVLYPAEYKETITPILES